SLIIFHIVLPQDVPILRPIILLATSLPDKRVELLVSKHLVGLPVGEEVDKISSELGLTATCCEPGEDAARKLDGRSGMLFVGHESSVPPHHLTHDLFKALPNSFLKVTPQQGFESIGFLHNAAHEAAYGSDIRFAADIVVGWFAAERLSNFPPAERSKLFVAGPPIMIAPRPEPKPIAAANRRFGMVCENLHSVRFTGPAIHEYFLAQFFVFAERAHAAGATLDFRPHPAGQFTDRMGLKLPPGVERNGQPLYEQELNAFGFAISPPSSILFDFVVAKVPTAVWIDPQGRMDHTNFAGLETVSSAEEWWSFATRACEERDAILESQERFLEALQIPADVAGRYAELLSRAQ
ncbi:MAG TPA: hypothetical protein VEX43_17105, partial [Chthoniobacterales bacterium]|nr:hypothetical protein [Chthoniobacterales bacterium]